MLRSFILSLLLFSAVQIGLAQEGKREFSFTTIAQSHQEESALLEQLEVSPDAFAPNFNLAIYYYNQAVNSIENLDYNDSDLASKQESIEGLFRKALQPALLAFRKDQKQQDVINMLSGIYFGLGDIKMSDYYKGLLSK